MKKHTVFVLGKLTYLVDTKEKAIALAEDDMKYIHPKFNMKIKGTRRADER